MLLGIVLYLDVRGGIKLWATRDALCWVPFLHMAPELAMDASILVSALPEPDESINTYCKALHMTLALTWPLRVQPTCQVRLAIAKATLLGCGRCYLAHGTGQQADLIDGQLVIKQQQATSLKFMVLSSHDARLVVDLV